MGLHVDNISRTYNRDIIALKDVSLSMSAGVLGLVGPNGAGKSTLLRTLATLQIPDCGKIHLDGIDLIGEPQRIRPTLGYLPQDVGVYPRVTAHEMLEYVIGIKESNSSSLVRLTAMDALRQVHLDDAADRRLDQFSLGMRQRFGIACAMVGRPRLLIVDEPTAGLDPHERRYFQRIIVEYGSANLVIMSTHVIEDIAGVCDQIAFIHKGRILANGLPEVLTAKLDNHIWQRQVPLSEVKNYESIEGLLGWRPSISGAIVRVHSVHQPDVHWSCVPPDLEDLYSFYVRPKIDSDGRTETRIATVKGTT